MSDLYAVLGVDRGATAEEIKAAYRRAASEAHPDRTGGDSARMARVNEAYEVLSDPKRRERYDETGKTDPVATLEERALQLFTSMLRHAIEQDAMGVIAFMRKAAADAITTLRDQKAAAERKIKKLERKRSAVRFNGTGTNLVHEMIEAQITELQFQALQCDGTIPMAQRVQKLVEQYDEDPNSIEREQPGLEEFTRIIDSYFNASRASDHRRSYFTGGL